MDKETPFQESPVNSIAKMLINIFSKVGTESENLPSYCEELSVFINQAYSTRNRVYHDINHAQDLALAVESPTAQLAALFHDVVYLQIDWARSSGIRALFEPFEMDGIQKLVIPKITENKWALALTTLFGFQETQDVLPFGGLNEFLSAWVAIQKLQGKISPLNLLKVAACIQATIPLWTSKSSATESPLNLYKNIKMAGDHLGIETSPAFLEEAVSEAVQVANQDVLGFAAENPRTFLYNSWSLLGESNSALQGRHFKISQYREALSKTDGFLSNLKADHIFRQFNDTPNANTLKKLKEAATLNLQIASKYITMRLIDTCIIETIALLTGGDGPLEMFIGSRSHRRDIKCVTIEEYLNNEIPMNTKNNDSFEITSLFMPQNAFRSAFDLKGAPISKYLFERMNKNDLKRADSSVRRFIAKQQTPIEYLKSLPSDLIVPIISAISEIAVTRDTALAILKNIFLTPHKTA